MTTLDAVRQAILASAAVRAIAGDRIRVDIARENDPMPFVIVKQTGNEPNRSLDGTLMGRRETFSVESWADLRETAERLHSAVEAALDAADMAPDAADPDALDPELAARACVWTVEVWTT